MALAYFRPASAGLVYSFVSIRSFVTLCVCISSGVACIFGILFLLLYMMNFKLMYVAGFYSSINSLGVYVYEYICVRVCML